MSTTAPNYLWLQAKVISTVSPTLLAASKSKSCPSQGGLVLLLGEFQLTTSTSAKKCMTCKGQGATQATTALLQAWSKCPSLCWIACPEVSWIPGTDRRLNSGSPTLRHHPHRIFFIISESFKANAELFSYWKHIYLTGLCYPCRKPQADTSSEYSLFLVQDAKPHLSHIK